MRPQRRCRRILPATLTVCASRAAPIDLPQRPGAASAAFAASVFYSSCVAASLASHHASAFAAALAAALAD